MYNANESIKSLFNDCRCFDVNVDWHILFKFVLLSTVQISIRVCVTISMELAHTHASTIQNHGTWVIHAFADVNANVFIAMRIFPYLSLSSIVA